MAISFSSMTKITLIYLTIKIWKEFAHSHYHTFSGSRVPEFQSSSVPEFQQRLMPQASCLTPIFQKNNKNLLFGLQILSLHPHCGVESRGLGIARRTQFFDFFE